MAPDNYYSPYYNPARSNPNQQSYGTYQSQMSAPPSAQYQSARAPTTSHQSDDYQSYTSQYAQQNSACSNAQAYSSNNWYATSSNDADQGRAAEALSRMSNREQDRAGAGAQYVTHSLNPSTYNSGLSSAHASRTAINVTGRGSSTIQNQPQLTTYVQSSDRAQQRPARPNSVNSVSSAHITSNHRQSPAPHHSATQYQPAQVQSLSHPQNRSISPAQVMQSGHGLPPNTRSAGAPQAAQQPDLSHRTLPTITQPYHGSTTNTAHYAHQQPTSSSTQQFTNGSNRDYEQLGGTVDPTQVYDPWPEYQRRLEAQRAAKAKEEATAAAKAEKEAQEKRQAEEANRAAAEARKAEEQRINAADEERARKAREVQQARKTQRKSGAKANAAQSQQQAPIDSRKAPEAARRKVNDAGKKVPTSDADEIKALMEQMRELNAKNPALLAQMWEEERQRSGATAATSPKPPTAAVPQSQQVNGTSAAATQAGVSTSGGRAVQQRLTNASQQAKPKPTPPRATQAPAPVAKQQTIWPTEKKGQLAAAAAKWLNDVPENKPKPISSDEISIMLDGNPTYIDLCERLEGMGFKVERASFARALLAAVPDVNSAAHARAPAPPPASNAVSRPPPNGVVAHGAVVDLSMPQPEGGPSRPQNAPPHTGSPEHVLSGHVAAQDVRQSVNSRWEQLPNELPKASSPHPPAQTSAQSPYFTSQPPPFPAPVAQTVPSKSEVKPPVSNLAPASKAEAARKRTFGDIVDLTSLSDDEPPLKMLYVPSPQQALTHIPRPTTPPGPAPLAPMGHAPAPAYSAPDASFRPYNFVPRTIPQQPPHMPVPPMAPIPVAPPGPRVAIDEKLKTMELVKPLDKKKALRRSTYNINTIARDVLLATSRHPDMRGLNSHLEVLKTSFKQVDNTSDLSTFRWDLVDPGDPIVDFGDSDRDSVDDADDEEESVPTGAQPRAAVRQPVSVGPAGTGGTEVVGVMIPLKNPVNKIKRRRGRPPRYSDPGLPSRLYGFGSGGSGGADGEPQNSSQSHSDTARTTARPSGSNANADMPTSSAAAQPVPSSATQRYSGFMGYSAFRQQMTGPGGTPLPKKRGRPVGWRKNPTPSGSNQTPVPSRPRPAQPSSLRNVQTAPGGGVVVISSRSPSVRRPTTPPEPNYSVYKCKWLDCGAELHNLETLRRHVGKLHGKEAAQGGYDCRWGACGEKVQVENKRTGERETRHRRFDFATREQWERHVQTEHLGPLAWELGDGPAGGLSDAHDSGSEAYLSDSHGRRVTPTVRMPPSAEMYAGMGAAPARRPGRPGRTKQTEEQKAMEEQERMERRKRDVGPGVDKGGATLANAKRRMGFVDDEEFEEVVDDE